jgi:phytoene/squalene synthetase
MLYDIYHEGFRTFSDFLSYAEGACVAPASIFIHFCGCTNKNDTYYPPCFDIFEAARPISIFSYLVHILRYFKKDYYNNLNYFSNDLLKKMGVKQITLKQAANGVITREFRWLINRYKVLINQFKIKSRKEINKLSLYLEPRYLLSLEIIFELYIQLSERIDIESRQFSFEKIQPSPYEIKDRIINTIGVYKAKQKNTLKKVKVA